MSMEGMFERDDVTGAIKKIGQNNQEDPLQDWRPKGDHTMSMERDLDEDEILVLENDPQYKSYVEAEDLIDGEHELGNYVQSESWPQDDAEASFNLGFLSEEEKQDFFDAMHTDSGFDPEFENKDMFAEMMKGLPEQSPVKKESLETGPGIYTLQEFALMEACSQYRAWMKKHEDTLAQLVSDMPTNLKGEPLTTAEVNDLAEQFRKNRNSDLGQQYSENEISKMKKAYAWTTAYNKVVGDQQLPHFADGQPLSAEQIEEMANEYAEFRKNNPAEFAQLKFEKGEWQKNTFVWKKEAFKGQDQWAAFKQNQELGKNIKYISHEEPVGNGKEYYYVVNHGFDIKGTKTRIEDIKLRYPVAKTILKK